MVAPAGGRLCYNLIESRIISRNKKADMMDSITVNGLHVDAYGAQNAPVILFLHGGGAGAWSWQPVIERLGEFRCLAPDMPEHGRSAAVRPFSIQDAAARMVELIRSQAPGEKVHVVGLSEGAQV
ncbi:alpha/beta fold hydrolase, partial [bacterium]